VFENMGLPAEGRKPYFAFSTAVIVINSVVGGAAVAVALGAFLGCLARGRRRSRWAAAIASVVGWLRYADRLLETAAGETEPLFPSPSRSAAAAPSPD
jgi:hypothetical protein